MDSESTELLFGHDDGFPTIGVSFRLLSVQDLIREIDTMLLHSLSGGRCREMQPACIAQTYVDDAVQLRMYEYV